MDMDKYSADVTRALAHNTVVLEKDGTLFVTINGNQDGDSIRAIDQRSVQLIDGLGYKPNVLIDVRNTGFPDADARKAIIDSFNVDNYNRQAIFGLNDALRIIASLLLGKVVFADRTKLCKTEAEARAWLAKSPAVKQAIPAGRR